MPTGIFNLKQQLQGLIQGAWSGVSKSTAPQYVEYLVVAGGGGPATQYGGGGAGANSGGGAAAGTNGTGGGGGAGWGSGPSNPAAGGGSGIVVVAVPTSRYSGNYSGSPTIITNAGYTIMQFYGSGYYIS